MRAQTNFVKKSSVPWLFAVIFLTILLGTSVYLGMIGFFFSANYLSSNTDLKLGQTLNIKAVENQASVLSLTFDGGFLPGEALPQVVQIGAENLNEDMYLRVKAEIFGGDKKQNLDFVTPDHFELKDDGYYYYDDVLRGGNKVTFCTYLVLPKTSEYLSKEKYVLTFVVETLSIDENVQNIWKNFAN